MSETNGKYYPIDGFTNNSTVYNYTNSKPSDSRTVIANKDSLLYVSTFGNKAESGSWTSYLYRGLIVSVVNDSIPENNGVYYCKETPSYDRITTDTNPRYKNADELWEKIGGFPIGLPTSAGDYVLTAEGEPGNITYNWKRNPLLPELPTDSGRYSLNIDGDTASWITAGMYFVGKCDEELSDGSNISVNTDEGEFNPVDDKGATVLCNLDKCLYTANTNGVWEQITFPCEGSEPVLKNEIDYSNLWDQIHDDKFGFLTLDTTGEYIDGNKFKVGTPLEFIFRTILEGTVTPIKYTVTTTVLPTGSGTVTGSGEYEKGSKVTITAIPNEGYKFNNWTSTYSPVPTTRSFSFEINKSESFTANFIERYSLTIDKQNGTQRQTYRATNYSTLYSHLYEQPARAGYTFNGWYTQASGGTKIETQEYFNTLYNSKDDVTIYAQWTQQETHNDVKYAPNINKTGFSWDSLSELPETMPEDSDWYGSNGPKGSTIGLPTGKTYRYVYGSLSNNGYTYFRVPKDSITGLDNLYFFSTLTSSWSQVIDCDMSITSSDENYDYWNLISQKSIGKRFYALKINN